ncbi:MAG TPA: flavin reductase family protein [Saprospiraceae bacterium]|nr:flavin reductase family protein [Saprospiraceae bacterium]
MNMNKALQKLSNGYYILTAVKPGEELKTRDKDYIAAGIVNWVSQISFEPLQIVVSVRVDSHLNETIDYSTSFTLHVLSEKQKDLINKFSADSEVTNEHINGVPYSFKNGQIMFDDAIARIECTLNQSVRAGDHTLQIGEVGKCEVLEDTDPLTTRERPSRYQGVSDSLN